MHNTLSRRTINSGNLSSIAKKCCMQFEFFTIFCCPSLSNGYIACAPPWLALPDVVDFKKCFIGSECLMGPNECCKGFCHCCASPSNSIARSHAYGTVCEGVKVQLFPSHHEVLMPSPTASLGLAGHMQILSGLQARLARLARARTLCILGICRSCESTSRANVGT